jgi:hypothetical protein
MTLKNQWDGRRLFLAESLFKLDFSATEPR